MVDRLRRRPPLGQHFLTNQGILEQIVAALDPDPRDTVIEIGAGSGTLTRVLAGRVGLVVAIEKDLRLSGRLRDAGTGEAEKVRIVNGDALRLDWHTLLHEAVPASPVSFPFKIVGNIPYNITSPLIEKALTAPLPQVIVFLVQAEVADRIAAAPGSKTYGGLSVGVQAVCRVEKLFNVAATAFRPPPRVRSAVIRLRPLSPPLVTPDEVRGFREFVTGCFSRRRKQLRNVLCAVTGQAPEWVERQLGALGIGITQRPETLSSEQFVRLFRAMGAAEY